ncbi:hypothetical protein BDV06DRAFT_222987 [Aspergillus oleicola]
MEEFCLSVTPAHEAATLYKTHTPAHRRSTGLVKGCQEVWTLRNPPQLVASNQAKSTEVPSDQEWDLHPSPQSRNKADEIERPPDLHIASRSSVSTDLQRTMSSPNKSPKLLSETLVTDFVDKVTSYVESKHIPNIPPRIRQPATRDGKPTHQEPT